MKDKKYTWSEISKQIDSVWLSESWKDNWGIEVIYKKMFKQYLKKKLTTPTK